MALYDQPDLTEFIKKQAKPYDSRLGQPTSDIVRFCFEAAVEYIRDKPAHKLLGE